MARGKFKQEDWDLFEEKPSKSELKKTMDRLQQIGAKICLLTPNQLKKIGMDESILDAILLYQRIDSNEAKRRQLQLIGKLMRGEDETPFLEALMQRKSPKIQAQLQRWIERMTEQEENAIVDFSKVFKQADRHILRQLVMRIQVAQTEDLITIAKRNFLNYVQQLAILDDSI